MGLEKSMPSIGVSCAMQNRSLPGFFSVRQCSCRRSAAAASGLPQSCPSNTGFICCNRFIYAEGSHMSEIFKRRKIPKHLIIREEYATDRKSRFSIVKFIFWGLVLFGITWAIIAFEPNI
jgi:hypothetical protein